VKKEINLEKVRADAQEAYKSGEFLCAEAVVHSVRANVDPNMPKEMIHVASGFPVGVGRAQCMCGTVSAGTICLGYFFGRTFPTTITDPQSLKTITLAYELQDHFKQKNKALCCHVHLKGMDEPRNGHPEKCAGFVGDMAVKTAEIVARELGGKLV